MLTLYVKISLAEHSGFPLEGPASLLRTTE